MLRELFAEAEVSEAESCAAAMEFQTTPFDLIFLDLNMPGLHGDQGLHVVKSAFPQSPVIIVSGEEGADVIRSAVACGASGFVPKTARPEVMLGALQLILAGGVYLPPQVLSSGQVPGDEFKRMHTLLDALTDRQMEVLRRALKGAPNKVIARELDVSEGTVKSHLSAAFRVLDVRNRTEALYSAAKLGLRL